MATFNYARLLKTVDRLITKFGVKTTFRWIVSVPNPNPSLPSTNTVITRDYDAVFTKFTEKEIDGIRILTGDVKVLVRGNLDQNLQINGSILDPIESGVIWKVIRMEKVAPGPSILLWKVQVRK